MELTIETKLTLNDGHLIPQLGLGVWQTRGATCEAAVLAALEAGYRLIDTAALYGNEESVGAGVRTSGIPRENIFVTTKLWNSDHDNPERALDMSLRKLKLDYVDLYLIHYPVRERRKSWRALEAAGQEQGAFDWRQQFHDQAFDGTPRRDEDGSGNQPGGVSSLFISAGFIGFLRRQGHRHRSL